MQVSWHSYSVSANECRFHDTVIVFLQMSAGFTTQLQCFCKWVQVSWHHYSVSAKWVQVSWHSYSVSANECRFHDTFVMFLQTSTCGFHNTVILLWFLLKAFCMSMNTITLHEFLLYVNHNQAGTQSIQLLFYLIPLSYIYLCRGHPTYFCAWKYLRCEQCVSRSKITLFLFHIKNK